MMLLNITKAFNPRCLPPRHERWRVILLASSCTMLLAGAGQTFAQDVSKPCKPTATLPCPPQTSKPAPSTAEQFPFPGNPDESKPSQPTPPAPAATSKPASTAEQFPFPGSTDDNPAPRLTQPSPTSKQPASSAEQFPFPGEPESGAASTPSSDSSSSSSSTSSSSSNPSDTPDVDGTPTETDPAKMTRTQRRHLPKVEDLDAREAKDLEVSRFYYSTGDFRAAYLRAQDAVRILPDDAEAHFALAESAARLNNREEAVAEYKLCLKLDPDGLKANAAQRALSSMKH